MLVGYTKKKMPQELCDYLIDAYGQMKKRAVVEGWPRDATQINFREGTIHSCFSSGHRPQYIQSGVLGCVIPTRTVQTHMMHLPHSKKQWIADIMQYELEKWCGEKLKFLYCTVCENIVGVLFSRYFFCRCENESCIYSYLSLDVFVS